MADIALDPVTETLLRIERQKNLNAMQIILMDGTLSVDLLRRAVLETLPRFPILLSAPSADKTTVTLYARDPKAAQVDEIDYTGDGEFSCTNQAFRRFVTAFSVSNPIHWESAIPIRFRLFQDRRVGRKRRSCLMINWSHAIADHNANAILLETLTAAYAGSSSSPRVHPFCTLDDLFRTRRLSKQLRAATELAAELGRNRLKCRDPRQRVDRSQGAVDFYHEILSGEWQRDIRRLSRAAGHTINTLFTTALVRAVCRQRLEASRAPKSNAAPMVCAFGLRNFAGRQAADHFRNFVLLIRLRLDATASSPALMNSIAAQIDALKTGGVFSEVIKQGFVTQLLRRRWGRSLARWMIDEALSSRTCFSNAGVLQGNFRTFGTPDLPVLEYIALGPISAPLDFVLFTCEIHGLIELDAIYFTAAFDDFERQVMHPVKEELRRLLDEYLTKS